MRCRASLFAGVFVGIVASSSGTAQAQSADDKAIAETLFNQGKALLNEGKYDAACPKLAESLRLDTGIGTMLYLAECYERSGKVASAWAQFREAQETAKRANDNREKLAKGRADQLEPKLSRVAIVVAPESEVPGLVVTRDGREIGRAAWGVEAPIDPGKHVFRATAPDREPWERTVDVAGDGARTKVEVPALAAPKPKVVDPAPVTAPPPPAEDTNKGSTQRTIAIGVGVLGVVGVGVGAFFGLKAISTLSDADARCVGTVCDQEGLDLRSDSRSQAGVSTVAFAIGGVALAGAAVLWFTAPKSSSSSSVAISPTATPGGAGLVAAARF